MADEVSAKKSRVRKDVAEAFTVLLLLAWNDIVVNGDKMSVSQIEAVMKVRAAGWVPILIDQYRHIPMKDVSASVLNTKINLDSGSVRLRTTKKRAYGM
jgi:molybdenum cofactor biosynthesis enzyme